MIQKIFAIVSQKLQTENRIVSLFRKHQIRLDVDRSFRLKFRFTCKRQRQTFSVSRIMQNYTDYWQSLARPRNRRLPRARAIFMSAVLVVGVSWNLSVMFEIRFGLMHFKRARRSALIRGNRIQSSRLLSLLFFNMQIGNEN